MGYAAAMKRLKQETLEQHIKDHPDQFEAVDTGYPVSYTHLDVYKRQELFKPGRHCSRGDQSAEARFKDFEHL